LTDNQQQLAKALNIVIDESVARPVIRMRLRKKITRMAREGKLTRNFLNSGDKTQIEWAFRIFSANQILGLFDWWGWESRSKWAWDFANYNTWHYPKWDGKPHKTIVLAEQGIGDEILFASCFKDFHKDNPDLTIECDTRLMPIFERSFPGIKFVTRWKDGIGKPWQPKDHRGDYESFIPAGSLPSLYRTDKASFPRTPYLVPRETIKTGGTGIVFRAGKNGEKHIDPSILGGDICLQHDEDLPGYENPPYSHERFDDYINLIASLDRVVAVPSAVVHIAGAIGTPCDVVKPEKERKNMSTALKWYYPINRDMDWYDVKIHQNPRNYRYFRTRYRPENLVA